MSNRVSQSYTDPPRRDNGCLSFREGEYPKRAGNSHPRGLGVEKMDGQDRSVD